MALGDGVLRASLIGDITLVGDATEYGVCEREACSDIM